MSEPNHKIDSLLKRFVKKRREEARADFELHPATRKLLQSEVARVFPSGKTETKQRLFSALLPRLALAGAFTAMLIVTVMMLNTPQTSKRGFQLADNKEKKILAAPESAQSEMREENIARLDVSTDQKNYFKSAAPAPVEAPAPKQHSIKDEVASVSDVESIGGKLGKPVEEKSARQLGKPGQTKTLTDSTFARREPVGNSADKFSTVTNAGGAFAVTRNASSAPASVAVNFDDSSLAKNHWKFIQQDLRAKYRQNYLSPAQPAILQSFELIQAGNKIKLFDQDGSIYEGEILEQDNLKENAQKKNEQTSEFNFRVAGMNQQLNRLVTFTGQYAATNADLFFGGNAPAKSIDPLQTGALKRKSGVAGNGSINGKVSIGGTNEFQIQATESPQ